MGTILFPDRAAAASASNWTSHCFSSMMNQATACVCRNFVGLRFFDDISDSESDGRGRTESMVVPTVSNP